jgi:hypothetical protein
MRAPTGSIYSNRFDITRGMSPMAMGSIFKKDGPSPMTKGSPINFKNSAMKSPGMMSSTSEEDIPLGLTYHSDGTKKPTLLEITE